MSKRHVNERSHSTAPAQPPAAPPAHAGPPKRNGTWLTPACSFMLVVAVVLAFLPAFSAGFVQWDDPTYVTENPALHSVAGLGDLWNPTAEQPGGYFPLVFTSFWVEQRLWELNPLGYHATNVLLHAINTSLVFLLARALGASPGVALVAAAVFGLHPAQVESVAWVTERKNTLSGVFYLAAFLLYLRHRRSSSWKAYATSVLAFGAAVLSKPETVTLPFVLLLTDTWLQHRGQLRHARLGEICLKLSPMLALAASSALITVLLDRQVRSAWVSVPGIAERLLLALNTPWFYAATFLAPWHLSPIYPKWNLAFTNPILLCGALVWLLVAGLLWRYRHHLDHLWLWGCAHFLVTLLPVLGLVSFNYQQESYVADRFIYLSCIGGGIAFAALGGQLGNSGGSSVRRAVAIAAGLVLVACGVGSYRQASVWNSDFSLWTAVLERNPDSFPPNINLARHYATRGQWAQAAAFYGRARQLNPTNVWAFRGYLGALGKSRGPQAVADACSIELQMATPLADDAYLFRAVSYELMGRREAALADYGQVLNLVEPGSSAWQQAQQARQRLAPAAAAP